MDDIDRAAATTDFLLAKSLDCRRQEGPQATGVCLNCGEPSDGRWCDADCRDEWTQEQRLKEARL